MFYTETVRDSDRIVRNIQSVRLGHAGRSLRGMSKSDTDKLKAEVAELKQQVKEAKAANTLGPDPEKEQMKADMAALKAQVEALAKAMQSQSAAPAPAQTPTPAETPMTKAEVDAKISKALAKIAEAQDDLMDTLSPEAKAAYLARKK